MYAGCIVSVCWMCSVCVCVCVCVCKDTQQVIIETPGTCLIKILAYKHLSSLFTNFLVHEFSVKSEKNIFFLILSKVYVGMNGSLFI